MCVIACHTQVAELEAEFEDFLEENGLASETVQPHEALHAQALQLYAAAHVKHLQF